MTSMEGSPEASSVPAISSEAGSGFVLEQFSCSSFVSGASSGSGATSFSGTASSGEGVASGRVSGAVFGAVSSAAEITGV